MHNACVKVSGNGVYHTLNTVRGTSCMKDRRHCHRKKAHLHTQTRATYRFNETFSKILGVPLYE